MPVSNLHRLDNIENLIRNNYLIEALFEAASLEFLPSNMRAKFAALYSRYQKAMQLHIGEVSNKQDYYDELQATTHEAELLLAEARSRMVSPPGNIEKLGRPVAHFIGRENIIEELQNKFSNGARIQILAGMSGIGKSRIAIEYAYRKMNEGAYPTFVAWIDGHGGKIDKKQQNSEEPLQGHQDNSIAARIIDLQWFHLVSLIAPEDIQRYPPDRQTSELLKWMGTVDNWLLIFDNVSNAEVIQAYIPPMNTGHIIVTTQNPTWEGITDTAFIHKVPELDKVNGEQLLLQRSGGKMDTSIAQKLLQDFGGYPFYLEAWAAVYAKPFSSNILTQAIDVPYLKQKDISESDKREEVFHSLMFSVLGINADKPVRLKGEGQAILLIQMMSPRHIPIDFINEYSRSILVHPEPKHPILKFLVRPILAYLKRKHDLHAKQRLELFRRLADYSLVHDQLDGTLSMHQIVHDFFKKKLYFKSPIVSDSFLADSILDFTTDIFYFRKNKPETIDRCRTLLPHMLSMAEFCAHNYPKADYLQLLYKRILDFLEYEERYAPAVLVAAYALDIQDIQKRVPSVDLISQCIRIAMSAGRFDFLEELLKAYRSYLPEEQVATAEGLLQLVKSSSHEQRNAGIEKLDQVAKLNNSDGDLSEGVDLITAVFLSEGNPALSEQKFEYYQRVISERDGEHSEEYAGFLTLKAKSYLIRSNNAENMEELLQDARDWSDQAINILADLQIKKTIKYWETLFTLAECERRLDNYAALKNIVNRFEEYQSDIEDMFGPDHLSLANIYFNMAYLLGRWEGETEKAIVQMEKVVEIYRKFYLDQPDHPDLLSMIEVLSDLKQELADEE